MNLRQGYLRPEFVNLASSLSNLLGESWHHFAKMRASLRTKVKRWSIARKLNVQILQSEYRQKGLDRELDRFILYRIIGNDLYPRHEHGQSRKNLQFILDHEPELEDCEKRFIVNRIVDRAAEAAIIELLEKQGQRYLHIPFDLDEYAEIGWDLESFPDPNFCFSDDYAKLSLEQQVRAEAQWRRLKNNYAINNNGARNVALVEGRREAKWVLPWDGNCFLTAASWAEIFRGVRTRPYLKYFAVPMARLGDNSTLFYSDLRPRADEEPQIIFRSDAIEVFDERFPYGRRPKVELLWRLGFPGPWDYWADDPWDLKRPALAEEARQFGYVGWVARLSSGMLGLERGDRDRVGRSRMLARLHAIIATLDGLDHQVALRRVAPER